MPSMRETVIGKLVTKLKIMESATLKVYRNLDKPLSLTTANIIVVRDGQAGDPEMLLSPLTYIYEQAVELEVIIRHQTPASRDSILDTILVNINTIINSNRTLDATAEWVEPLTPTFQEEPIEGAPSIRMASLIVMIRFSTSNPLN